MLLPEPESPLTKTSCIKAEPAALLVLLHLAALPREELGGGVDAAQLEDLVAHRGFDQHREVAAGGHRNAHAAHADAEDLLRLLDERQPLARVAAARLRALEVRDEPQLQLPAYRGLAADGADVQ